MIRLPVVTGEPTDTGRRACLRLVVGGTAWMLSAPARAHTPYGQWKAYRQKHLTIGCHRDDPVSYELAKTIVAELDDELPDASARVARGPSAARLASLLGTDQMQVAVLSADDAVAMTAGVDGFEAYGPTPLRLLLRLGDEHVLMALADMPERHVTLVVEALLHSSMNADVATPPPAGLERHVGVMSN